MKKRREHPNQNYRAALETLHRLANLRRDAGDYEQAQMFYSEALRLCEENFEPSHGMYKMILADYERFRQELDQRTE